jgi:hypothetical protein
MQWEEPKVSWFDVSVDVLLLMEPRNGIQSAHADSCHPAQAKSASLLLPDLKKVLP